MSFGQINLKYWLDLDNHKLRHNLVKRSIGIIKIMAIDTKTSQFWDVRFDKPNNGTLELVHFEALKVNIINLLRTPYGDRGMFFKPDYGTRYHQLLQEPISEALAFQLKHYILHDLRVAFSYLNFNYSETFVELIEDRGVANGYRTQIGIDPSPYLDSFNSFRFTISNDMR